MTLKTEIRFALAPDLTSSRDSHPAHAEVRDFKGLLAAIFMGSLFVGMRPRAIKITHPAVPTRSLLDKILLFLLVTILIGGLLAPIFKRWRRDFPSAWYTYSSNKPKKITI